MGDEEDMAIAKDMVSVENEKVKVVTRYVDWSSGDFDYEGFSKQMKEYDISFLVLPRLNEVKEDPNGQTFSEKIPAF